MPFKLFADGAQIQQGVLDDSGSLQIMHSPAVQDYRVEMANGVQYDLPVVDAHRNAAQGRPANDGFLKHERGAPAADTGDTLQTETLREFYRKAFKT